MANRLINEESPYLMQHAHNPVDWFPWGPEALNRAQKENKPIFLSIGYSSCHWCHVMEKESFEDKETAKILNEHFISIKVDKEERPDIDKHFQEVFVKMNRKPGGWPLSIFLTPDLKPFYSATYIPPEPRYGIIGFKDLLNTIIGSYQKDPALLARKGQDVLEALKPKSKIEATKLTPALIDTAAKQIKTIYDKEWGGFGDAPKFPSSYVLNLAMNLYKLNRDEELKEIVTKTLDSMLLGGIYDIVEGGFCRYSTDRIWLVPHFEKMTYDNALMSYTLLRAHRIFKIERYREIAVEILQFMLKKMSKEGLFFSASDADSEGGEGAYFVYGYNEAKEAFKKYGLSEELLYDFGITQRGNFEGKSIVRLSSLDLRDKEFFKTAKEALLEIRKKREYPFVDKKVITSWNAMMIASLFEAAKTEPQFLEIAKKSLAALESKMVEGVNVFHSALITNRPKVEGFLEDYAWLVYVYIQSYNLTLDEMELIKALNLVNEAIKRFYRNGFWIVGNKEFKNFAENYDTSYPSSVAVMAHNLLTLRSLAEPVYEKFAFKTLEVNSYDIMRQPISSPTLADAAIRYIKDDNIIKSNKKALEEIKNLEFAYPYTLFKTTPGGTYEVCTNRACFANAKSKEELIESLKIF